MSVVSSSVCASQFKVYLQQKKLTFLDVR